MCIILDANKLGEFLAEPRNKDSDPIHQWLKRQHGRGKIVYSTGGHFAQEISGAKRTKLKAYFDAGLAQLIPAERFADDEQGLQDRGDMLSDDPHVLALARASGARLLYTADRKLMRDFKDKRFINQPKGQVYSRAGNAGLLTNLTCANLKTL